MLKKLLMSVACCGVATQLAARERASDPVAEAIAEISASSPSIPQKPAPSAWDYEVTMPKGTCYAFMPGPKQTLHDARKARDMAHLRRDYANPSGVIAGGCEIVADSKECKAWLDKKGKFETARGEPVPGIYVHDCTTCAKATTKTVTEDKKAHWYSKTKPTEATMTEYQKVCQLAEPYKVN